MGRGKRTRTHHPSLDKGQVEKLRITSSSARLVGSERAVSVGDARNRYSVRSWCPDLTSPPPSARHTYPLWGDGHAGAPPRGHEEPPSPQRIRSYSRAQAHRPPSHDSLRALRLPALPRPHQGRGVVSRGPRRSGAAPALLHPIQRGREQGRGDQAGAHEVARPLQREAPLAPVLW